MPYFVASIMTITSALIIMMTRFDADDSLIRAELERMKSMFLAVNGFVNTYIDSDGDLTEINFQRLSCDGILLGNIRDTIATTNCATTNMSDATTDDVRGFSYASVLTFPRSDIRWQILPIRDITSEPETQDFASSAGNAYRILVDMSQNRELMHRSRFSESFVAREFCEKMLFGNVQENRKTSDVSVANQENFLNDGTNDDGIFVCTVFK